MAYAFNDDKSKYDLQIVLSQSIKQTLTPLDSVIYNNSYYYKIGHQVAVGLFVGLPYTNTLYEHEFRLPEGYRPEYNMYFGTGDFNNVGIKSQYVKISSDGYIDVSTTLTETNGELVRNPVAMVCMFDVYESES